MYNTAFWNALRLGTPVTKVLDTDIIPYFMCTLCVLQLYLKCTLSVPNVYLICILCVLNVYPVNASWQHYKAHTCQSSFLP